VLNANASAAAAAQFADFAARELAAKPLASQFADARARADLGRAYAALADRASSADRAGWTERAAAAFDDSLAHWRAAKFAKVAEAQRTKQITAVQAGLAKLSHASPDRRPRS